MSLLVICEHCNRKYDAGGREIGSRFRCHCGEVVTVAKPKEEHGHNAAVVRCSSCGAPRKDQADSCGYCHADFTLHEQDLDTVCPSCFARVSHKAAYCHACGDSIEAESCTTLETNLSCPSCEGVLLHQREIGSGTSIMECSSCMGIWVRNSVLQGLIKEAKEEAELDFGIGAGPGAPMTSQDMKPVGAPVYRCCPDCNHHMRRHIFAKKSGVIIDSCKEHGVWFDAQELDMILQWVRAGGSEESSTSGRMTAQIKNGDYTVKGLKKKDDTVRMSDVLNETLGTIGSMLFSKW